jgi:vacuolar-type H+-ATPase subunit F/Vma7
LSRLLVITRPELAAGFLLAGVEAFPAADVETAVELIEGWLDTGEDGLLVVDDGLLAKMAPAFLRRMEAAVQLPFLAIPGGEGAGEVVYRHKRISDLTRRAIGFHSIFKTEKPEEKQP